MSPMSGEKKEKRRVFDLDGAFDKRVAEYL